MSLLVVPGPAHGRKERDLILSVFGSEQGARAGSAVGVAARPLRIRVEIEGELELAPRDG